jgi:hypothetical protein
MTFLKSGRLVATSRRDSPTAPIQTLPNSSWKELRIVKLDRSTCEERTDRKIKHHDVRIYPALLSPRVEEILEGKTLGEICRQYVFDDPQVSLLREQALEAGGKPANFGFEWNGYNAVWPLELAGYRPPLRGLMPAKSETLATRADSVLIRRLGSLVELLQHKDLVCGMSDDGRSVDIPRSVWHRKRLYLDLENSDLFEASAKETSFWETNSSSGDGIEGFRLRSQLHEAPAKPLFRSLMIKFHGKPILSDHVRADPIDDQPFRSKSVTNVERRKVDESECASWLNDIVKSSPDRRKLSNATLWKDAKSRWPNLSERAFHRIRSQVINDTGALAWAASGAPKKSP